MISTPLVALVLPFLSVLPAGPPDDVGPGLQIALVKTAIVANVTATTSLDFLGAVIVSDSDVLRHYLVGLPPLLGNFVVLGVGVAANGSLTVSAPAPPLPAVASKIFAQAVTLDAAGIVSSDVETLVLPAATR